MQLLLIIINSIIFLYYNSSKFRKMEKNYSIVKLKLKFINKVLLFDFYY